MKERTGGADRPLLTVLDPESGDARYWVWMRERIVMRAEAELERRRARAADYSVTDVVVSWARPLVPAMMAAALVAGLILTKAAPAPPGPVDLVSDEEIAINEVNGGGMSGILATINDLSNAEVSATPEGF